MLAKKYFISIFLIGLSLLLIVGCRGNEDFAGELDSINNGQVEFDDSEGSESAKIISENITTSSPESNGEELNARDKNEIKNKDNKNTEEIKQNKSSISLTEADEKKDNNSKSTDEDMQKIKVFQGKWEVNSLLYRDRVRFSRDSDDFDRELTGKSLVINEDLSVFLNGTKYVCDTVEELNLYDFGNKYAMIWSEIDSLGENIVCIGLKKYENNSSAKFGLLIDGQKKIYIFGGEWFNDRGIYSLKKIE